MKGKTKNKLILLAATLMMFGTMSMNVMAAETDVEEVAVVTAEGNIITGTLGDNNGILWSYDTSTKILTVTGEDSGIYYNGRWDDPYSPFRWQCGDVESIIIKNCKMKGSLHGLFGWLNQLKSVKFVKCDTSDVTDMSSMFYECHNLEELDISDFDTSNVTDMSKMFLYCGIKNVDLSGFDTSNVKDMNCMFSSCGLTSIDVSNFDTSKVTNMYMMFDNVKCSYLDLSNFDTSNVTDMSGMFQNSKCLYLDLSGFDTRKVTDMYGMFYKCQDLEGINISGFDTSNVKDMGYMFYGCNSLREIDLNNINVSKAENIDNLLGECVNLQLLHTPNELDAKHVIALPGVFYDLNNNEVTEIADNTCGIMLVKTCWENGNRNFSVVPELSEIVMGSSQQLQININDVLQSIVSNARFYTWSVDDPNVLSVSNTGLVTGIGMGTATVTCVNKADASEYASFDITIRTPFTDIKTSDWQYPFVVYAYENNLMSGKGEGKFDMNGKLTRAEFVTVLHSYTGKPAITYENAFTDVKEADWFATPVIWAKQNNVTAGNPDGTFGVHNKITREQLVVMLYQYAIANGVAEAGNVNGDLSSYGDLDEVSSWAVNALTWGVEEGILSGKTKNGIDILDPKGNTTRGECATMMMRYVELTK